jgi:hypothetical protein
MFVINQAIDYNYFTPLISTIIPGKNSMKKLRKNDSRNRKSSKTALFNLRCIKPHTKINPIQTIVTGLERLFLNAYGQVKWKMLLYC